MTYTIVALPSNWYQINLARAEYFMGKAEKAYQTGDLNEAVIALSMAYEYDPTNYDAGLSLAKLWQAGRADLSNHLYERLMLEHPAEQPRTAQTWLRALLLRADYSAIEVLAARAIEFDPEFVPAWIHELLFSNERSGNTPLLTRILQSGADFPPGVREVLTLETEIRARPGNYARNLLGHPPPADVPSFVVYYQLRRLIGLGNPDKALELLQSLSTRLSDRDGIALKLKAFSADLSRRAEYARLFEQVLALEPSMSQIKVICAHLIASPDPTLYNRVKQRIDLMRLPTPGEQITGLMGLFSLSAAHKDLPHMSQLASILRQETGSKFNALNGAEAMIRDPERVRIDMVLSTLQPMSLDLIYAMLERFDSRES
ncbi:MAG: hypothetical protein J6386_12225 [Candidatus Synoicihabitans palmerolidicus]|nr:hypothetical protein [Candidatus Synoicihabitans palmerolidicus]